MERMRVQIALVALLRVGAVRMTEVKDKPDHQVAETILQALAQGCGAFFCVMMPDKGGREQVFRRFVTLLSMALYPDEAPVVEKARRQ